MLKAGLFYTLGVHCVLPGVGVWKLRTKATVSCSGCGAHCAVFKTGPEAQSVAGFPCWAPAGVVWDWLFFSFDNTDCVTLCPIKAVEFDPSCLLVCTEIPARMCLVSAGESWSPPATGRPVALTAPVGAMAESKAFAGLVGISWSVLFSPFNPDLSPWHPGQ